MATEISKLFVTIGAKTEDFEKGLKSIQKNLDKAGAVMMGIGTAIIGSAAMSIKSYVEVGDEIHKMGLRTGFSAEMLSRLRYAAQIGGTTLEGLEVGIKRMSRVLVEASWGLESANRSLVAMGLNIDDLMAMNPEEQFMALAEALAAIEDPTLRAALAQEVFGRSGTDLLPILAEGIEGLRATMGAADDLGIVMDKEAAEKAARLQDAMTDVNTAVLGVKVAIAEALVPALTPMVEKFSVIIARIGEWAKANPELIQGILKIGAALLGLGATLLIITRVIGMIRALAIALAAVQALMGPKGWIMLAVGLAAAAAAAIGINKLIQIPEMAEGAIVREPTLSLIGEKGPEAVIPLEMGIGTTINISQMVVREEADIYRIARELEKLQQLRGVYA